MVRLRSEYNLQSLEVFRKYSYKNIYILSYVCSLLFIGVGILFAFLQKSIYVVYLLLGVLLPILVHLFPKIMENKFKNVYFKRETVQIFTFDEEGFELEQISNNETFKEKYSYSELLSIIKYKEYYFMYINRSQAFIVCAKDFISGNEEELDELFKKCNKDKFFIKKRK